MDASLSKEFNSGKSIGFGFVGQVNKSADGQYAIKRFPSEAGAEHEYKVAQRLSKIPLFVDHIAHDGKFVKMELVKGKSPLRNLKLNDEQRHALVRGAANGLASALKEGLIPWDLTSGNILISDEGTPYVKIIDFGSWGFYEDLPEWYSKARAALGLGGGLQPLGAGGSAGAIGEADDLWESFGKAFGRISKNQTPHHNNVCSATLERLKGRSINNRTREIMIDALSEMGRTPTFSS